MRCMLQLYSGTRFVVLNPVFARLDSISKALRSYINLCDLDGVS